MEIDTASSVRKFKQLHQSIDVTSRDSLLDAFRSGTNTRKHNASFLPEISRLNNSTLALDSQ